MASEKKKITVETEVTEDKVRTITTETQEVGLFTRFRFGYMTILAIIVLIVFIPVIVFNISIAIQGIVAPEHVPNFFGVSAIPVASKPKEKDPLVALGYKPGDLVFFERIEVADIKEGDVLVLMQKNDENAKTEYSPVFGKFNRFVEDEKKGKMIVCDVYESEAVSHESEPFPVDKLEGRVTFEIGFMGHGANFLSSWQGIVILVVIPIGLYFLLDFLKSSKEKKKKDAERERELEELRAKLGAEGAENAGAEQAPEASDTETPEATDNVSPDGNAEDQ